MMLCFSKLVALGMYWRIETLAESKDTTLEGDKE